MNNNYNFYYKHGQWYRHIDIDIDIDKDMAIDMWMDTNMNTDMDTDMDRAERMNNKKLHEQFF